MVHTGMAANTDENAVVFDMEADGYRDEATRVWCICLRFLGYDYLGMDAGPDQLDQAIRELDSADHLIGHNIIDYDLPVLKRLLGWEPKPHVKITDTVVLSRLLRSDRLLPDGAPGNLAPHSLAAWGYRVGRGKPDHNDWSAFSEDMLHRCHEDVEINVLVYEALLREQYKDKGLDWSTQ